MHLLFAPDSFKGSLSAGQIIRLLERAAQEVFPGCETAGLPMADGGEGTMEALMAARQGQYVPVTATGPLWEQTPSRYAVLDDGTALVEAAAAAGLPMVPPERRDPEQTTTFGVGELIGAALDRGCRKIVVGVGGSATNDGGMGALAALGVRFLDEGGAELKPVGGNLGRVAAIDGRGLHPAAAGAEFTVMCDIDNPLTGPRGAARVFGPQKGGTPAQLDRLEAGMVHYSRLLARWRGADLDQLPGGGAAGGLAAGLRAALGARLCSGIETVLQVSGFNALLAQADLVVTGEGRADGQSAHGKVLWGVGRACRQAGVPAVALVGGMGQGADRLYELGIDAIWPIVSGPMTLDQAMARSGELCYDAALRLLRTLRAGMALVQKKGVDKR